MSKVVVPASTGRITVKLGAPSVLSWLGSVWGSSNRILMAIAVEDLLVIPDVYRAHQLHGGAHREGGGCHRHGHVGRRNDGLDHPSTQQYGGDDESQE